MKNSVKIMRGGAPCQRKRGFTITELVIVIAVIAILAAVLIPTFANLLNKANESADMQTVKNLNTILSAEQTVSQTKPSTMSEALAQAEEGGYVVDKLSPTSEGNDILWDQYSNRFVLADENGKIIFKDDLTEGDTADDYNFWKITKDAKDLGASSFSLYLSDGFASTTVAHSAGIDVGENKGINVTYESTADRDGANDKVIVRTNGGTLTVNAANSTVKHYDAADTVEIVAVAGNSYHEHGVVETLTVGKGHIYIESQGTVGLLDCTNADNSSRVGKASAAAIGTVYVKDAAAAETLFEESMNSSIENDELEFVTEEDVSPDDTAMFAGGLGTKNSPFLIATAEQFLKINELTDISKCYKLIDDIDLGETITGYGGEDVSMGYPNWYNYIIKHFAGELDGDGHTISVSNQSSGYTRAVFAALSGAVIKNVVFNLQGYDLAIGGLDADIGAYGTFDSVIVTGDVEATGNNHGVFLVYAGSFDASTDLNFLNCINRAKIIGPGGAQGYDAIFIGYILYSIDLTFENCVNEGTMMSGWAAMFVANFGSSIPENGCLMKISGCKNEGNIVKTDPNSEMNNYYAKNPGKRATIEDLGNNTYDGIYKLEQDNQFDIELSENNTFNVTQAANEKAVKYTISFEKYFDLWQENAGVYTFAGTLLINVTETFTAEEFTSGNYTSQMKYIGFVTANYEPDATQKGELCGYELVEIDGKEYYRVGDGLKIGKPAEGKDGEGVVAPPKSVSVTAYDADGKIVAVKSLDIK